MEKKNIDKYEAPSKTVKIHKLVKKTHTDR